ncbi:Hsp70 family protein [Phytomonospora sp. NPDC050363]|uniref:Hsp70 family protein n=1 Tax=Phytomonospora sp. NPDC050363 TaxID=3155642 RepID=UPI00340082F4
MPASPHLGVDFGTSHTVAVLRRDDGRVEPLMFDGTPLLPSAVFAGPDGVIGVGADAIHAARSDPASFEPHPKRRVDDGTVLLGEREFAVEDLFAAVLAKVRERCAEVAREVPAAVTLTHPAAWGPRRKRILRAAAGKAGLPQARLLPEPVAAAAYYVRELRREVAPGAAVVVHDFGGGTFDASVVRRTAEGFEVLAVDGLDDLGGVDVDEALAQHLRDQYPDPGAWARLLSPQSPADRRHRRIFREDVRLTKERLSRQSSADLYIPVLERDVHVTRDELETLTTPLLARAVAVTTAVMEEAGVSPVSVAGVFLVGGGSRMPLVATLLHRQLGRAPAITDHIEQIVAHGAILGAGTETTATATAPVAPVPAPPQHRPEPAPAITPPPKPAPAKPSPRPKPRPTLLWALNALLGAELLASFLPVGSGLVPREQPPYLLVSFALLVVAQGMYWWRVPISRRVLVTAQFAFAAAHAADAVLGPSGWAAAAIQLPFIAAGILGVELAASRAAADWYRVPDNPAWNREARARRALTALAVAVVVALTVGINPPWTAQRTGTEAGQGGDGDGMPVVGSFVSESPYVSVATHLTDSESTGVGLRADGRVDVFDPFDGGVTHTYDIPFPTGTDVELAFVDDRLKAVVGTSGHAYIFDVADGSEHCEISGEGEYFTEFAMGLDWSSNTVMASAGGDDFGLWDVAGCTRIRNFGTPPPDGPSDLGLRTFDGETTTYYASETGVGGYYDLTGAPAATDTIALPGRPALAVIPGGVVTALGERVTLWDPVMGQDKRHVDVGAPIMEGGLLAGEWDGSTIAVTVDTEGSLRVCDLGEAEELGEHRIDLGTATPVLGFSGYVGRVMILVAIGNRVTLFDPGL